MHGIGWSCISYPFYNFTLLFVTYCISFLSCYCGSVSDHQVLLLLINLNLYVCMCVCTLKGKWLELRQSSLLYLGTAPSLDCAMQGGTLRVCTMGDEVNPCVTRRGRLFRRWKGVSDAYAIWCHCHSLSLAPVNPDWFYLSGTGSPR